VHSGDQGPAFTYPRFSKQKVIPPSPTRTSPAFRRSRTEPFYAKIKTKQQKDDVRKGKGLLA